MRVVGCSTPLRGERNPFLDGRGFVLYPGSVTGERARDVVWDTLVEIFGEATNTNTKGQRNKAVKLLKESGATPEEIKVRWERYGRMYSGAAKTPLALANRWDDLGPAVPTHPGPEEAGATWTTVEYFWKAQYPSRPIDIAIWQGQLSRWSSEQVIRALRSHSFSSPYAPGVSEIERRLITEELGPEAPPSPQIALAMVRQLSEDVGSGLSARPVPPAVSEAITEMRKVTNSLDDRVFLEVYGAVLERIYSNYGRS